VVLPLLARRWEAREEEMEGAGNEGIPSGKLSSHVLYRAFLNPCICYSKMKAGTSNLIRTYISPSWGGEGKEVPL